MSSPHAQLEAVLPLTPRDIERAKLLLESLALRFSGLRRLWVVAPDSELSLIEAELAAHAARLPLAFERESSLVPEFGLSPLLKGWYRQQVIKLAIHERVETEFYLTLDADVLCTRSVSASDLTADGRAACHVIPKDLHPDWYRGSFATLGLDSAPRGVLHNVTPAVLHRDAVRELALHLEARALRGEFSRGLRGQKQRVISSLGSLAGARYRSYRLLLCASAPFTEYALYYSFLEHSGRFERYHRYSAECIYDVEGSLWRERAAAFESFDPEPCFAGEGPPWFFVVQSNTRIDAAEVRRKFGARLCHV